MPCNRSILPLFSSPSLIWIPRSRLSNGICRERFRRSSLTFSIPMVHGMGLLSVVSAAVVSARQMVKSPPSMLACASDTLASNRLICSAFRKIRFKFPLMRTDSIKLPVSTSKSFSSMPSIRICNNRMRIRSRSTTMLPMLPSVSSWCITWSPCSSRSSGNETRTRSMRMSIPNSSEAYVVAWSIAHR